MKKIFFLIAFLFGTLLFLKFNIKEFSREALPQNKVSHPQISADRILIATKGVQYYCNEHFEVGSCISYWNECGESCYPLISPQVKMKMVEEYNRFYASTAEEKISSNHLESNSVIGQ